MVMPKGEPAPEYTKNPIIAAITGGSTISKFSSDFFGGLPAASESVSNKINAPLKSASDLLSNTNYIKEAAAGINAGGGGAAVQVLSKLSDLSGAHMLEGATGGLYKAPEIAGATNDFSDKVLKSVANGIGQFAGISAIGGVAASLAPGVAATNGLTSLLNQYPLLARYAAPFAGDFVKTLAGVAIQTQLNPALAGDIVARAKTLAGAIATAPLYTALGTIKSAGVSVPVSFGLGFGMAKLSGADNKTAVASGVAFAIMDGVGRMGTGNRGMTSEEVHAKLENEAFETLNRYSESKLTRESTPEEIKAAYRAAAHQTHPDVGGAKGEFEKISSAYDLLSKGKVSSAPKNVTPEEESVKTLKGEIQKSIKDNGPDATHLALQEHLGVDQPTAAKLVTAAQIPETAGSASKGILARMSDTSIPSHLQPLAKEAANYASAEDFADHYSKNVDAIPTTDAYKKYVAENDAFVAREKEIYSEMKGLREKYKDLSPTSATPAQLAQEKTDRATYADLQKELDSVLSKKTTAKSPPSDIKTHIGEKALKDQLVEFHNKATGNGPSVPEVPGATFKSPEELKPALPPEEKPAPVITRTADSSHAIIQIGGKTEFVTGLKKGEDPLGKLTEAQAKNLGLNLSTEKGRIEAAKNPVGEGETKQSKLAERTGEKGKGPSYQVAQNADQRSKAAEFVKHHEARAKAISEGREAAPEGHLVNAITSAYKESLMQKGDTAAATEVLNSQSLRSTRYGQEIQILSKGADVNSPEYWFKQVQASRMSDVVYKTEKGGVAAKSRATEKINAGVKEVKEILTKEQIKIQRAEEIINSLMC